MKLVASFPILRKAFSGVVIFGFLLVFLSLLLLPVHAFTPTITNISNFNSSPFTGASFGGAAAPLVVGDIEIISVAFSSGGIQGITATVNVGACGTATQLVYLSGSNNAAYAGMWLFTITSLTCNSINVALSTTITAQTVGFEVVEISGGSTNVACSSTTANVQNIAPYQTASSCSFSPGQVALSSAYINVAPGAGTGYTLYSNNGAGPVMEYSVAYATVVNPTFFPYTGSTSTFVSIVGVILGASTGTTQTQTIGSCPSVKNDTTIAPVNSTIYLYSGNALGSEVVNTIQFNIGKVTGSAAVQRSAQVLIYATPSSGAIGPTNPLTLLFSKSYFLNGGTKTQSITTQVSIQLNNALPMVSGNNWAVGLVADSHVPINGSNLHGLTTLPGNPAGNFQPATFTTGGTANSGEMFLCATGSYQSQISVVTTTTAPGTTTNTVFTTSTQTTLDTNAAINSTTGYVLLIIVVLTPAMAMAVALGVFTRSPQAAGIGFVGGLMVGSGLGSAAGIVPAGIVYLMVFIGAFIMFGVFVFTRGGGGG